jgi:hypothetical protein
MAESILIRCPVIGVSSEPSSRNEQLDRPQATLPGIDLRQVALNMAFWATWRYYLDRSIFDAPAVAPSVTHGEMAEGQAHRATFLSIADPDHLRSAVGRDAKKHLRNNPFLSQLRARAVRTIGRDIAIQPAPESQGF